MEIYIKQNINNEYFAIKEIKKIKSHENKFLRITEVIKKKMECDNSVKLIESIVTEDLFYIISELCYLNLADFCKYKKRRFINRRNKIINNRFK